MMVNLNEEILQALTEKMSSLYVSYRKRFVLSIPGASMFTPKRKNGEFTALTDHMLTNHLLQKYAVAIYSGESASKFLCFDVDDGSADTVHTIIDRLAALGIPQDKIYVSFSGGKGYHVELFFDRLVYTSQLYALYGMVIEQAKLNPRKVEFRPTYGNAIKLPLSIHGKTGNVCWFVEPET